MSELGLVLLLLAGFAQGSFGLGMKKQSPLSWESFWLIYSLFAMLVVPFVWGYAGFDSFMESILMTDSKVIMTSLLLGFLWGIASKSAVIPSLDTAPYIQYQKHQESASSGGERKRLRKVASDCATVH